MKITIDTDGPISDFAVALRAIGTAVLQGKEGMGLVPETRQRIISYIDLAAREIRLLPEKLNG